MFRSRIGGMTHQVSLIDGYFEYIASEEDRRLVPTVYMVPPKTDWLHYVLTQVTQMATPPGT